MVESKLIVIELKNKISFNYELENLEMFDIMYNSDNWIHIEWWRYEKK